VQPRLLIAIAAVAAALPLAHGDAAGTSSTVHETTLESQARAVVTEFFRTINERRYERTCTLLIEGRSDPDLCLVGLRVGFMWSQEIRFRVTGVRIAGDRAIVSALADGVPGKIVLLRTAGRYGVLRLQGT